MSNHLKENKFSFGSLFGKSIYILFIRIGIVIANLIIAIYFSHHISQFDYGSYISFYLNLNVLIVIGSLGMSFLVFNFTPDKLILYFKSINSQLKISYLIYAILLGVLFAVLLGYQEVITIRPVLTIIITLFFVFQLCNFILENALLLFKNYRVQIAISFLYAIAFCIIAFRSVVKGELIIELFIINWTLLSFIKLIAQLFLLKNEVKKVTIQPDTEVPNMKKLWIHYGIYDMVQMLFRYFDKILITYITTKEAAAIYFNGRYEIPFIPTIASSIRSAALMVLNQHSGDHQFAISTAKNSSKIINTIVFALIVFGWFFGTEFFTFIFSEKYISSVPIFQLSLLLLPAQYGIMVMFILQHKERGDLINKGAVIDIVLSIVLLIPLYQWLGSIGLVWAFLISTYSQSIYYLVKSAQLLAVHPLQLIPLKNWVLKIIGFVALAIVLNYILQHQSVAMISIVALVTFSIMGFIIIFAERKLLDKK